MFTPSQACSIVHLCLPDTLVYGATKMKNVLKTLTPSAQTFQKQKILPLKNFDPTKTLNEQTF